MLSRLRRRFAGRGCLSRLLVTVGVVGLVVAAAIAAFGPVSPGTRTVLSWVAAVSITVVMLARYPTTRPHPLVAGDRSRRRAGTGRMVIVLVWLVRAGLAGTVVLLVTDNFENPGFHPIAAGLAAAGRMLTGFHRYGRQLAGFVGEWQRPRLVEVPRKLLAAAVAATMAGFAADLANVAKVVFEEGPGRAFGYLHGSWGVPGFFAVLMTILLCLVASVVIVFVVGVLQRIAAVVIGDGNAVGDWLDKTSPVKYVRGYDYRHLYFKFIVTLRSTRRAKPSDLARERQYKRMLKATGPLSDTAYDLLTERVLTAALPLLPPGCRRFRVSLHVAGDHEEIVLETEAERRLLTDFPRAAELRRFRVASQVAPGTVVFTAYCEAMLGEHDDPPQWSDVTWSRFDLSDAEPEWFTPATRDQYAWELRRWPVFSNEVPDWLRRRLLPGPAYAQRQEQPAGGQSERSGR